MARRHADDHRPLFMFSNIGASGATTRDHIALYNIKGPIFNYRFYPIAIQRPGALMESPQR